MPAVTFSKVYQFPLAFHFPVSEERLAVPASEGKDSDRRGHMPETVIPVTARLVSVAICFYLFYFFSEEKCSYFSITLNLSFPVSLWTLIYP